MIELIGGTILWIAMIIYFPGWLLAFIAAASLYFVLKNEDVIK